MHGDDVVQLARRRGDGRRAELALVVLLREHGLPRAGRIAARLEKVKEDLARRARQALPAIGEPPAHPGLQHLQLLVKRADDAVLAAAHPQPQAPPLAHAPHDHLGAVPLGQELPPDVSPGFLSPRYLAFCTSFLSCFTALERAGLVTALWRAGLKQTFPLNPARNPKNSSFVVLHVCLIFACF